MAETAPILWWVRRDLRLGDNPGLAEAAGQGRPVIPVAILDEVVQTYGTCAAFRYGLGLDAYAEALADRGSRLIFRRGQAVEVLRDLVRETGADTVLWGRAYDPDAVNRDRGVKEALTGDGLDARSVPGHVIHEPWTVETTEGSYYSVFTPFWRAVKDREVPEPLSAPSDIPAPERWPESDDLADWRLGADMRRGAEVVRPHLTVGEGSATSRLGAFVGQKIATYDDMRDIPGAQATSQLSENLTWGEISPRTCWHSAARALADGQAQAEDFMQELIWRDFAYHLAWHTPRLTSENWRPKWDAFPWNEDGETPEVRAWKEGRTGIPFVDAAMREMYVTGRMHNRSRMVVASYLTKHLMSHWRIGKSWFEEHLADWDPASNAMGWQWAAGSGPDATPFFRVFNPETQVERFDKDGEYRKTWIAEGNANPRTSALSYFDAIPERWNLSPDDAYPDPVVGVDEGRKTAMAYYEDRDF